VDAVVFVMATMGFSVLTAGGFAIPLHAAKKMNKQHINK
jgi:hypothetical protein